MPDPSPSETEPVELPETADSPSVPGVLSAVRLGDFHGIGGAELPEFPPEFEAASKAALRAATGADLDRTIERLVARGATSNRRTSPDLLAQLRDVRERPADLLVLSLLDIDPAIPLNATLARRYALPLVVGAAILARSCAGRDATARLVIVVDPYWPSEIGDGIRSAVEALDLESDEIAIDARIVPLLNEYPQADPTLVLYSLGSAGKRRGKFRGERRRLKPDELPTSQGAVFLDAAAALAVARSLVGESVVEDAVDRAEVSEKVANGARDAAPAVEHARRDVGGGVAIPDGPTPGTAPFNSAATGSAIFEDAGAELKPSEGDGGAIGGNAVDIVIAMENASDRNMASNSGAARAASPGAADSFPVGVHDHQRKRPHLAFVKPGITVDELLVALGIEHDRTLLVREGNVLRNIAVDRAARLDPGAENVLQVSLPELPTNPDPCIRCGWCYESCPTRVQPANILEAAQNDDLALAERAGLGACIDCGICSYVCPARLPLLEATRIMKLRTAETA